MGPGGEHAYDLKRHFVDAILGRRLAGGTFTLRSNKIK
jgi:hypothetical protein